MSVRGRSAPRSTTPDFTCRSRAGMWALVQPDGQNHRFAIQLSPAAFRRILWNRRACHADLARLRQERRQRIWCPQQARQRPAGRAAGFDDSSWSSGLTGLGLPPRRRRRRQQPCPGPGYYAPYGPNGTWNYYEVVSTAATWTTAESNAAGQSFGGQTGHLVTVRGSAAEVTYL